QSAIEDTKVRRKTKRVALEGKFIYTTDEVIEIIQKAEAVKQRKQPRRNVKKRQVNSQIQEPIEEDLEIVISNSEDDTITVRYVDRD
ncbi:hypothetical protein K431DRAFT_236708, partial [Polychaeton citri CBS 116435]